MTITQLQSAVRAGGVPAAFGVVGGVPPYTWSVLPAGAGGSIGPDGLYISAPVPGVDTVQVEDSAGAGVTATINVCSYFELVCDIIQHELGLEPGRVYMYNQKIMEPKDDALYVVVQQVMGKAYGATKSMDADGNEQQVMNLMAQLQIDIKSRSTEALYRKEEVALALCSAYAEQSQELNSFKIARLPTSMNNVSIEDGAAIPYHFVTSVNVIYAFQKMTATRYYDQFQGFVVVPNP